MISDVVRDASIYGLVGLLIGWFGNLIIAGIKQKLNLSSRDGIEDRRVCPNHSETVSVLKDVKETLKHVQDMFDDSDGVWYRLRVAETNIAVCKSKLGIEA
jgi:hypothetical protein